MGLVDRSQGENLSVDLGEGSWAGRSGAEASSAESLCERTHFGTECLRRNVQATPTWQGLGPRIESQSGRDHCISLLILDVSARVLQTNRENW